MRRLVLAAAVLSAACAGPKPCTRALCPIEPLGGSYRVKGWLGSVSVSPGAPAVPIVNDSTVDVVDGRVKFSHGKAVVSAASGASFIFRVSTAPLATSLLVTAGDVSVESSSGAAPSPVPAGAPYILPDAD